MALETSMDSLLTASSKDNLERALTGYGFWQLQADALDSAAHCRIDAGCVRSIRPRRVYVAIAPDDPVDSRHVLKPPLSREGEIFPVCYKNLFGCILGIRLEAKTECAVAGVLVLAD